MEQCKKSQPSTYLFGDINMSNPDMVCLHIQRQLQLVWLGVVRQIYTSIDQGIKKYQVKSLTQNKNCIKVSYKNILYSFNSFCKFLISFVIEPHK